MIYFTSDFHLGETRIGKDFNPFFRPFKTVGEQNQHIISSMNKHVKEDDVMYHLGDVAMSVEDVKLMEKIKCKNRTLILGNYDVDDKEKRKELDNHFDKVTTTLKLDIGKNKFFLNHYPTKCPMKGDRFSICGHIHGLWKVQPNMVNVGVDAWHFKPVSLEEVLFVKEAIDKHYDDDVFPLRSR